MISVIVYGRNDAHGYNGHRRVALSLNCIAEVLTDPGDEIIFTDYNTPDELPTLVEAIADTLTERCRSLLRVLRVRAAIHEHRFAARTPLPVVEPVSRNAAARRANPSNRWLLSTTTDMILLPLGDESLSEICARLPDGFYGIPRFELPEWLWESLPRGEPENALPEVARLGPLLRLNETTVSYDWILFDAPGDFQLILREDFLAVDGFDEEMLLGWHVDSNLSKRLVLHRGSIQSLEEHVAGYHCNHLRTPTIFQTSGVANDLGRFVVSLDRVELPAQRVSWGLAETTLEQVRVGERYESDFVEAVLGASATSLPRLGLFDARETKFALEYDSGHVLPFVADSLRVSPPDATIGYIGANPELEKMLGALVTGLGLRGRLVVAALDNPRSVGELDQIADVFVVDLGIDASLFDSPLLMARGHAAARSRAELMWAFDSFRRLVELERAQLAAGAHARRFVLVNSSAVFWNEFVLAQLRCSPTTPHARVRQAIVKALPDESDEAKVAAARALQLARWMLRRDEGRGGLEIRPGSTIAIADLGDYAGFGEGWASPDKAAVWTQGSRSELSIAFGRNAAGPYTVTMSFDAISVAPGGSLRVTLLANGEHMATLDTAPGGTRNGIRHASEPTLREPVAWLRARARAVGITRIRTLRWLFYRGVALKTCLVGGTRRAPAPKLRWSIDIPAHAVVDGTIDLTLGIEPRGDWHDEHRRGLHLTAITAQQRGRPRNWSTRSLRRSTGTRNSM